MATRKLISNFSRGEFAPELYGRVDIPQYEAGAKSLKNFIVQRYGGAAFRPGFRFVAPILSANNITRKLVPFQYSIEQSYVHVFGNEEMNVAALGGMIAEDDLKIVSATNAAQMAINVPFHAYTVGDWLYLTGNTGMSSRLNGRFVQVATVIDANNVALSLDSTAFGALTASSGITRVGAPAPPPAPQPPLPPPPAPPVAPVVEGGGSETEVKLPGWRENGGYLSTL